MSAVTRRTREHLLRDRDRATREFIEAAEGVNRAQRRLAEEQEALASVRQELEDVDTALRALGEA